MATAVIEKVGGKLMFALPRELRDDLDLAEGDTVSLKRDHEALTVAKPRGYTPEELVAEHEQIAHLLEEDRAWLDAPRVGRELI